MLNRFYSCLHNIKIINISKQATYFDKGLNVLSKTIKESYPWVQLAHTPTPLERMPNLAKKHTTKQGEISLWIKRDDCTGLAMGGNKARQLEFYLGEAQARGADTILTTGAVQSNHVRMTVAGAHKLGMNSEVQLEQRVTQRPSEYYQSGNPLLLHMMGATIHNYPEGEDEHGADRALYERAKALSEQGKKPYVIPLSQDHTPLGALGYVLAAEEILLQTKQSKIDAIIVASGSGSTHGGLLTGLRALGSKTKVYGICVRRDASLQGPRILDRCKQVAAMINHDGIVTDSDIIVNDSILEPGYGRLNPATNQAILGAGKCEGILLDPTYSGKAMAGLITLIEQGEFSPGQNIMFLHTGGAPGAFGYPEMLNLQ